MQESLLRSQRQVQQVKLRLGLQMDDKAFQAMINESGVGMLSDNADPPGVTVPRPHQVELRHYHGAAPGPTTEPKAVG